MYGLLLIAQSEVLPGGSGWAGLGVVGLVLSWLLFVHLPAKDKQLKEFIDSNNARVDSLIDKFTGSIDALAKDFESDLKHMTEHCEKELTRTVEMLKGNGK